MNLPFDAAAWQIWLALGIALAIAEVLGTQFILLALGLAFAMTALVTRAFDPDIDVQLLCAALWAALLLPAFVVFYRRRMMPGVTRALVSDGLGLGETFSVVRRGERLGVKIQGDFFPVDADGHALAEGDRVVVMAWRGICAVVQRAAA